MIKIGGYILDKDEMSLSLAGECVKLEPKVLDVLIYFCNNENRYISMAELHENVWQDRCVSDAAVRRSIGKLRQLFNDDHKDPSYIQSLPKRGYKLICQVSKLEKKNSATAVSILEQQQSSKVKINTQPDMKAKPSHWQNKTMFLLLVIIITLFFIAPIFYGVYEKVAIIQTQQQFFNSQRRFLG